MASSFGGINTALTSLYAQRRALDVTGQNIANANTEGYTRQRVSMQSQVGSITPAMYATTDGLGTGVAVSDVQRVRDQYLENRGRTEHANSAYLTSQSGAYAEIENVFAEPGSTALQAQLHDMWDGWGEVANNPQLPAARAALIQQSSTVADGLNYAHAALADKWGQNRKQLSVYTTEVNTAAQTIAQLNDSIVQAKATGLSVNELEDRRDLQVLSLSKLTGATASVRPNGAMDVYVGSSTLVSEFTVRELEVSGAARLDDQADTLDGFGEWQPPVDPVVLRWADTKTLAGAGGTMGSIVDTLTTIIPGLSKELNAVAEALADTVNTAQMAGYSKDGSTGPTNPFFTSKTGGTITAGTIKVAIDNLDKVATAAAPDTVDGSVAERLAKTAAATNGPDLKYQTMIGALGVAAQASGRRNEIQATVTEQADADRQAQAGVNLDEEMTNMLMYQRGYEAAARVLTTIDSMLDQLINRTGLVGR